MPSHTSPPTRPRRLIAAVGATVGAALVLLGAVAALAQDAPTRDAPVFGAITVEGNTSTQSALILHELGFAEGDPFDFGVLDRAWEHLEDLGWFAYVDLVVDDEGSDVVPVTVVVEEDATLRYYPIIDYDRRWDVLLGARVYDINLRGRGERLSLAATWYARHGYDVDWEHPWLFGVDGLSGGLDAGWERADFVHRDTDFDRWQLGARVRWDYRRPLFAQAELSAGGFRQDSAMGDLPDPWPAATRRRTTLRGTLGLDSRNQPWYPTRGFYHRLMAERVLGDGFDDVTLLTGDLRAFLPLPWDHVLALRSWGRRAEGRVPPEDLLWWGGPETLRGYGYAGLVGDEGYLLSAEYRWPLFLMTISGDGRVIGVGLHAFSDLGANWFDGGGRHPLASWGGGAHINISNHQFRFELAVPEHDDTVFQFMDSFNF
jgi:outer membrane protein assembly factor BamA